VTATADRASITWSNPELQLKDIIKSIPKEFFLKNRIKAWFSVIFNVLAVIGGYVFIAFSPWYLLPVAWLFTGTALTGFFVLAHDCGHRSFANRRWVNDLVGHTLTLPLIYPFHCWRILHNRHHAHTNKHGVDNAWDPWELPDYEGRSLPLKWFYQAMRGWFWFLGSIAHWGILHFNLNEFLPHEKSKAKLSITVVVIFALIFFPTLFITTGFWGVIKFWLMPWLFYHFWMSTFTLVHHTAGDIQFRPVTQWSAAEAQLAGTVHCTYPKWVEVLCHDINVHIPHHVSTAIPSYNLRKTHEYMKDQWGHYMKERVFSWELMHDIADKCHIYDAEKAYKSFEESK
jgi:omega-6 fatty acid desaturase (delta-12 desaturase)